MVFNMAGYRYLFSIIDDGITAKLENKIDNGLYTESQLVEIRIPLNMPYYSDKDYENVYGETDWNGNHYRYVKRKVSGNTLYLLCLPNAEKTSLEKAKSDFTKSVNDIPGNKQGNQEKNNLIKIITTVFNSNEISYNYEFATVSLKFINNNLEAKDLFTPLTESQPPETLRLS